MDQVWLVITVLSLIAGMGLLAALFVLRRLSGYRQPPLEVVVGALIAVGVAAFFGVYLRLLDVPRSSLGYRIVNAGAWGYAVFASLYFLYAVGWGPLGRSFAWMRVALPVAAGTLVWVVAFVVVHAPPRTVAPDTITPAQPVALLLLELTVAIMVVMTAVAMVRTAPRTKSIPWRNAQRGTAHALFILVPANLLEFLISLFMRMRGHLMPDGFLFSAGYGIACAVLASALFRSLRVGQAGDTTGGTPQAARASVPDAFVTVRGITPRERDIIEKLLEGKTDREIGELLFISPRTVDTHLRNIFRKCDVGSRLQLAQLIAEFRRTVVP